MPDAAGTEQQQTTPFRFYDNRQKYLAFINTCNEKHEIAAKAAEQLVQVRPTPPALRIFDAGVGDATVLSRLLRTTHRTFPTVPLLVSVRRSVSKTSGSRSRRCPTGSTSIRTPCS